MSPVNGCPAVVHLELREDVPGVGAQRVERDEQPAGDLRSGQPGVEQPQHLVQQLGVAVPTPGAAESNELRSRQIAQRIATLEIELSEERNPSIRERCVAEATLYLKGATLRAKDATESMSHTVNLVADELARQVKRHRDKRRGRRETARVEPRAAES